MDPEQNPSEQWTQPTENLGQAPYVAPTVPPADTEDVAPTAAPGPELVTDTAEAPTTQPDDEIDNGEDALLRWQANEHVSYEQNGIWYAVLGLVVVALMALAIFVFNSIWFAVLIPVMLVSLVIYVRRPPAEISYTLSRKGLYVNEQLRPYDEFKAFGVIQSDGVNSVAMIPRKRFQLGLTVYFPEQVGEGLVDMLAARLPMQEVKLDAIDKLLKKLRI